MKFYVTMTKDGNAKLHDSLNDVASTYKITGITEEQAANDLSGKGISTYKAELEIKRYALMCVEEKTFETDTAGNPIFVNAERLLNDILERLNDLKTETQAEITKLHALGLIRENIYKLAVENKDPVFTEFPDKPHVISKNKLNKFMRSECSVAGKDFDFFSLLPDLFPEMGIVSSDKDVFALTEINITKDVKSDKFEDPNRFYSHIVANEPYFREALRTAIATGSIDDDTITALSVKTELMLGLKIYTLNI